MVGSALGTAASGLISKSVAATDIKTGPDTADSTAELQHARARYYDALVEAQTGASGKPSAESQRELAAVKDHYNEVRRSQGLEPIK
jgi:hypothetical protein